jgi:hypothetical protein
LAIVLAVFVLFLLSIVLTVSFCHCIDNLFIEGGMARIKYAFF